MAKIIVTDYLVALQLIVEGWKVEKKGDNWSGPYWELTKI